MVFNDISFNGNLQCNYSFAAEFTVRSHTTPDCLQFCRPCVAKAASLFQIPVHLKPVGAALKLTLVYIVQLFISSKLDLKVWY